MRRVVPQALCVILVCTLACSLILTARAGLRGTGKYCGAVVFDRWDTCFLLSGRYITYISEAIKNERRPYSGRAMQIDASDVVQPRNPGDALIRKYKIIGPAPRPRQWAMLHAIELVAESDFGTHEVPIFLIEIRNTGATSVVVDSLVVGPVFLGLNPKGPFAASGGKSEAWITRGDLVHASSWGSVGSVKYSASYTIDPTSRPAQYFQLEPGQSKKVRVIFKVPPGHYQFMVRYGGGVHEEKSIASNAVSIDVNDKGMAIPV
jgi:hypothetical protein